MVASLKRSAAPLKVENMRHLHARIVTLIAAMAVVMITGTRLGSQAEATPTNRLEAGETTQAKIERAMSAGPPEIARSAKIIDQDAFLVASLQIFNRARRR